MNLSTKFVKKEFQFDNKNNHCLRYRVSDKSLEKQSKISKFNLRKNKIILINAKNDRSVDKCERYFPDHQFIADHTIVRIFYIR